MQKSELKILIKQLVRESLTEIFAEMHLETIVENVVKKSQKKLEVSQPTMMLRESNSTNSKEDLRRMIVEKVAADDSEWGSIYKDTLQRGNPILDGDDSSDAPELVSEEVLRKAGLMKDYSKFVK